MNPEPVDSPRETRKVLSGMVVTGAKQAAFFTQLDWVKTQCLTLLGFEPYPGTLNLMLSEAGRLKMEEIQKFSGLPLIAPNETFCRSRVFPIQIGNLPGAIILPEESVRIHGSGIVEILAPVCLREVLKLQDGDRVSITVFDPSPAERQ